VAVRRLKRELGLGQVLMLGTAGTIAAEIFVLTGHVAGMVGPAAVLVLLLVGVLNYTFALNYSEMATAYPVTGGAMTYVQEAHGSGLLAFLVGSLDCLSSAFYAALSAVGFAYSLRVFVPAVPLVPTALVVVAVFTLLNVFGVGNVGRAQVVLGGILLALLAAYVGAGLGSRGYDPQVFMPDGRFFIHDGFWRNAARMLSTMALIFNAYIGFEIIADDAEEIRNPTRNIPIGLIAGLTIITLIYVSVAWVTLGVLPWQQMAGSETALSDAAARMLPRFGAPMIAVAGIIATLTSINSAMLSARSEALTLSRLGLWPRFMSRLGRARTPYAASLIIGAIVALTASIGLVEFLSYISSAGYLFVVFWASMSMAKLRKLKPDVPRPFKVPLFPLSAYLGAAICAIVVAFTAIKPLLFVSGVLLALTAVYLLAPIVRRTLRRRAVRRLTSSDRIIVAVANAETAKGLVHVAALLAEGHPGTGIEVLGVTRPSDPERAAALRDLTPVLRRRQHAQLEAATTEARERNVPFYTEMRVAMDIGRAVVEEVNSQEQVGLVLMGWPGQLTPQTLPGHPVARVLHDAHADVGILLNRGLHGITRVVVPFGGGVHSLVAVRLAGQLAEVYDAELIALRVRATGEPEEVYDELLAVQEVFEAVFGEVPAYVTMKVIQAPTVEQGILQEVTRCNCELVVMGSSVAYSLQTDLFGVLTDRIAERMPCSVLLVRRFEPSVLSWLRRRLRHVVPD
jgi:amino acid transporter